MRTYFPRLIRVMFLVGGGVMVPACGGGPPPPPPGPAVLFDEEFDAFPNAAWSIAGTGAYAVDPNTGTPAPSLTTDPGASPSASLDFETVTPIGGTDLTFSADMLLSAAGTGTGTFAVLDSATSAFVAAADVDGTNGDLTLSIGGTTSAPIPQAPGWHSYAFSYDAAGNATWLVDGGNALSIAGFVPPNTMVISLQNNSGATVNFDTVVITSP